MLNINIMETSVPLKSHIPQGLQHQIPQPGDLRPIPDPSVLTTQQLAGAIAAQRDVFETRLDAMDKAFDLLQQTANRSPTIGEVHSLYGTKIDSLEKRLDHKYVETETIITHLRDLVTQRIDSLEKSIISQFGERDKRNEQLALVNATATSSALQAQKEAASETLKSSSLAITKSEIATADSIKQLQTLFQTAISGLSTQVLDVKSRLDKGEGMGAGRGLATEDYRYERGAARESQVDNRGLVFSVVGIAIGVGALVVTILINVLKGVH